MNTVIMNSIYEFYKLSDLERVKLIGSVLLERRLARHQKKGKPLKYLDETTGVMYFPVALTKSCFNYMKRQGLIAVSPIWDFGKGKWFSVYAKSPDDLDIILEFNEDHICIRDSVLDYVKSMKKLHIDYKQVMLDIQKHFNAGELF